MSVKSQLKITKKNSTEKK